MRKGKVYLIGAGPFDSGLITVKGLNVIKKCDVIFYDHLVNPELLSHAKKNAEIVYVGKRSGLHSVEQENIHRLIKKAFDSGSVVGRLKGGDPMIFGRGGEEALFCAENGIPFEVVPGITAGIAAPAYAGIPLTHREFSSSVTFVSGHKVDNEIDKIEWDILARLKGTLVFYMGIANLSKIVKNLLLNGMDENTPVALIRKGCSPGQVVLSGTLKDIVNSAVKTKFKAPAVIVAGEVAGLRDKLNWYEKLPLFGKRIVITRGREQSKSLIESITEQGGIPVLFSTIEIAPPDDFKPLDSAIKKLSSYGFIVFTSVNSVEKFFERLRFHGFDLRALKEAEIAAVGKVTKEKIEEFHLNVDIAGKEFKSEGLLEAMLRKGVQGKKILIPRAEEARDVLPEGLAKAGAVVDVVPVYKNIPASKGVEDVKLLFLDKKIDAVTFTSSSTVKNFASAFKDEDIKELIKNVPVFAIGPVTAETVRKYGIRNVHQPEKYTTADLLEKMVKYFQKGKKYS